MAGKFCANSASVWVLEKPAAVTVDATVGFKAVVAQSFGNVANRLQSAIRAL
jgi:hypothetical protein